MNNELLRRELRRIAIEESRRCFGCGLEHNCGTQGCAIIRDALERLALGEDNAPLTLEELLKMRGEPVCVHLGNGKIRWAIVSSFGGAPMESDLMLVFGVSYFVHASAFFSNGSRIYRHKPEGLTVFKRLPLLLAELKKERKDGKPVLPKRK